MTASPTPEPSARRIVVFTGDPGWSVRRTILDIDAARPGLAWLVMVHAPRKSLAQLLRSQRLNLRRNGWRWVPYQLGDAAARLLHRPKTGARGDGRQGNERRGNERQGNGRQGNERQGNDRPGDEFRSAAWDAHPRIEVARVDDIHAEASLARVHAFGADLGLSLAAPILKAPLFSIPRLGTVNLHKGKVPFYRGMPPAFWELWNDESVVGCTVHSVDKGLDTGAVVRTAEVERERFATLRGLQLRLDEVGATLMRNAVLALLDGSAQPQPQVPHAAKAFRKPTLAQVDALARKMAGFQPPAPPPVKRILKSAVHRATFGLAGALAGRWPAPRVTVLLYHRVSDAARDNLTVGVEQFDRQMALIRRHCEVLSIEEVLATGSVARRDRPVVAVTFDDGYLDNYEHAAPIMRRHGVPGAFFVSTGMIDTGGRFPHDVRRGNENLAVMTWEHLRTMRRWGFTIGSHTVNHLDCAAEGEALVRAELAASRDRLRDQLAIDDVIFAYPYGGRRHMTAERLALVREAGYTGCLAAYGGSNIGRVDPFNVLRRGIHWEFSDRAFLVECLGLGA